MRRSPEPIVGAFALAATAFLVTGAIAVAFEGGTLGSRLGELWPFALTGLLVPGVSHVLFLRSVQEAGPARAAVAVGTAPILSALLAIGILGEPFRVALAGGTVLIVVGGALLAWERTRPLGFRARGIVFGLGCAAIFGVRDNLVRWASSDLHPPPLAAAATSAGAGAVGLLAYMLLTRREGLGRRIAIALPALLPAGVCFGLSYDALLEAFARGPVTVVAPLNATQTLWAVLLAALLLGRTELIGRRLVLASLLIVAGGAFVGVAR